MGKKLAGVSGRVGFPESIIPRKRHVMLHRPVPASVARRPHRHARLALPLLRPRAVRDRPTRAQRCLACSASYHGQGSRRVPWSERWRPESGATIARKRSMRLQQTTDRQHANLARRSHTANMHGALVARQFPREKNVQTVAPEWHRPQVFRCARRYVLRCRILVVPLASAHLRSSSKTSPTRVLGFARTMGV